MKLTDEQMRVVQSRARRLAVLAGAGATKTTTLCAYATARRRWRLLYLAYNKPIQLEAADRMPANVRCRTTHSMAWPIAMRLFGAAVSTRVGNTYPSTVARAFGCGQLAAAGALLTIQRWCGSTDERIGERHVPPEIALRLDDPSQLIALAREVWSIMIDPRATEIRLPHDGYLKLFQLERPVLRGVDGILVDEGQDLNACTFDIVQGQDTVIAMVGDPAQSMYSFRGTTNVLEHFDAEERLPLTCSFRFGQRLATLTNHLLGHFRPGIAPPLMGAGHPQHTRLSVDARQGFAVLARTNAGIFGEAVAFLGLERPYHFVGGIEGYKLDKILDAYHLCVGEHGLMRDPYLRSFRSFDELVELAEEADEAELKHLVRVTAEYGAQVPALVEQIRSRHVDLDKRDWRGFGGIFFSTAHKAKGLEFEQVWLTDDFMQFFDRGGELGPDDVEPEEVHILHVALTRARAAVRLSEPFREWLIYRQFLPE